jgi:hypothetical protein
MGGQRIVDAMGPDDDEITWSGRFRGPDADLRARVLDGQRRSGALQILAWGGLFYSVIISSFAADYERFYHVGYKITVTVVDDPTQNIPSAATASLDDVVNADMSALSSLAIPGIPVGVLSAVTGLSTAITAAYPLAALSASAMLPLQQTASLAVGAVSAAQSSQDLLITAAGALAPGLLPGVSFANAALNQLGALQIGSSLADMSGLVGRVSANLDEFTG